MQVLHTSQSAPAPDSTKKKGGKMQNNPRILIVLSCYIPLIGGTEKQAQLLAETLTARGWSVQILTKLRQKEWPKEETINGVKVWRYPFDVFGIAKGLWDHRKSYDILFFMGELGGRSTIKVFLQCILGCLAKRFAKKKILIRLGSPVSQYRLRLFKPRLIQFLLKQFDLFLPISGELKTYLQEELGVTASKIINPPFNFVDTQKLTPVDSEKRNELRQRLGLPLDRGVLVFVGRVIPRKGLDLLLDVFPGLGRDCFLLLLLAAQETRSTDYGKMIEARIRGLESLRVKTIWNEPEITPYLQASDLLILPSTDEGKGTVQFEAMACGLPCVCSNIGPISESLPPSFLHFTFDPASAADLKTKLDLALAESADSGLKLAARNFAVQFHSEETMVKKYSLIFYSLSERKHKILIQTPWFYPRIGGIQSATLRLTKEWTKRGHEVMVLTRRDVWGEETENINEVSVHRVNPQTPFCQLETILWLIRLLPDFEVFMYWGNCTHFSLIQPWILKTLRLFGKKTILVMSSINEGSGNGCF